MSRYILALDQGTTSSRAIVFDHDGRIVGSSQAEFEQILPAPGIVEHDAEAIWTSQLKVAREALDGARLTASDIAAIGIANQRETTILWDRRTGKPVGHAIVWQSRVSAGICEQLEADGAGPAIREKSGLLLDAYFSGSKIKYLLDRDGQLRRRAERGDVLFGTVDSWLLWRLTCGKLHATDVSNASRTLLFNIHDLAWDDELAQLLDVPLAMLPDVRSSSEVYAHTDPQWFGEPIPVASLVGDQHAATFGQACFKQGTAKNTYGTGCFLLLNTGSRPVPSENRLLTTVGWKLKDQVTYCLEGAIFVGGAVVGWLRDGLGLIGTSADVEALAASVPDAGDVMFVPAFVGLGAPHWDPYARGTIVGISRGTTGGHIARAAVESMAFQSHDLLEAMQRDAGVTVTELKVDGGASVNNAMLQFQADLSGVSVVRPIISETTALGAAYLAGLAVGYWNDCAEIEQHWQLDCQFSPQSAPDQRQRLIGRWRDAVGRSRRWATT